MRESKYCSSVVIKCSALWTASKQLRPSYWPLQTTQRHDSSCCTVTLAPWHTTILWTHTPHTVPLTKTVYAISGHSHVMSCSSPPPTSRTLAQICAFRTDPAPSHMNAVWIKGRFGLSMHRPVILANLIAVTKLPAALFAFHWSVCLYFFISGLQ